MPNAAAVIPLLAEEFLSRLRTLVPGLQPNDELNFLPHIGEMRRQYPERAIFFVLLQFGGEKEVHAFPSFAEGTNPVLALRHTLIQGGRKAASEDMEDVDRLMVENARKWILCALAIGATGALFLIQPDGSFQERCLPNPLGC